MLTQCSEAASRRVSLGLRFPQLLTPIHGCICRCSWLLRSGASSHPSLRHCEAHARKIADAVDPWLLSFASKGKSSSEQSGGQYGQDNESYEENAVCTLAKMMRMRWCVIGEIQDVLSNLFHSQHVGFKPAKTIFKLTCNRSLGIINSQVNVVVS
jgi:hypothetical protein